MIIDAQVHVWKAATPEPPWRAGATAESAQLPQPLGYEDLLREMDRHGIDGAVLVPPGWEGDRIDFVAEGARRYPNRFAAFGRIPVEKPEARAMLADWREKLGMHGLRLSFQHAHNRAWMGDGTTDWVWPAAEATGIPIMLFAPHWLTRIGKIAAAHPALTIIVDHMGLFREQDEAAAEKIAETVKLARHPNVFVKVTSAPLYSSQDFPYRNMHEPLRRLIDAFGPRRAFWGTDLSRLRRKCGYREALAMFTEELDFLKGDDLAWVMGRGLSACLGWRPART
jgi:predicted TIM-barrel fold metal-dependent hydrolase